MKQKLLFLLTALMLLTTGNAWGETIPSMGNNNEGMASHQHSYTVAANKTLTLNFTVTSTKGKNETQGYYVNIKQGNNDKMGIQPGGGFYYYGDPWWNMSHMVANNRSWDLADFKTFIQGATVELTIKRIHTQVLYYADITTTAPARHYLRLITKEETFDENADITVILGADYAVLTDITDVTTDESITGTLIGKEDNSVGFGTNNFDYSLSENSSVSLHFINYSSKIGNDDNWLLEIQKGDKYLDLRASGAGWQWNSDYYNESNFTKESTTGTYADNFPVALHKADVNLTVTRSGNTITMQAVQKCVSGEVKTLTYTLTHADFASGAATVRLMADWSHLDLLPVTTSISSYGWATFSSDYALDFSKATTGLEAYIITGHSGNAVTKSQVTGTVPAGTGLLLKGAAGSYNIPIVGSSSTDVSGNLMKAGTGASVASETGKTKYVLGVNAGKAEFQKIVSTAATVPTGKAYLEFNAEIDARTVLNIEDDFTGINAIEAAEAKAESPKDGKFLENGKIVIVKNGVKYSANGQILK